METRPTDYDDVRKRLVEQYTEIAWLAGQLAHDIKNPLSTIGINIDLLVEDLESSDSPRDGRMLRRLEKVRHETKRLEGILNDFLQFARANQLQTEPSNLNQMVRKLVEFHKPEATDSNIELITYLATDLPSVMLDTKLFHAAMLNLVLNAEQAMPEGGQLVIRTYVTGDCVAMDLIDTGCGMDPASIGRIFDPFFSTKPGGSGLGLPTARKVVEAHGGRLVVQSEPGRGSKFTIRLPMPARLPG